MSGWREVCRWDVEPTVPIEVEDVSEEPPCQTCSWPDAALSWRRNTTDFQDAFDSLIACYEELAGEHRETVGAKFDAAVKEAAEGLFDYPPSPGPGWYWTRGYWTPPRRSKLAAIEPDHPTVQADPAAGEIDTLQGQGEARNADGTPYIVGESGVGSAIPQSGEERSDGCS